MEKFHPKALIFDWDDHVVATHQSLYEIYQKFSQHYSHPVPPLEQLQSLWGNPLTKVLEGLFPDLNDRDAAFEKFVPEDFHFRPLPRTVEKILEWKQRGYLLGVVSSGPRKGIERSIRLSAPSLKDVFYFIHSADDCSVHKPDPCVFDEAFFLLNKKDIYESDCLYSGDSVGDYLSARDRGMDFIATLSGFTPRERFINAGLNSEFIVPTLPDIDTLLS
jgi:phosphoglycolate phosphatase-like HAD superfamily hydrolase